MHRAGLLLGCWAQSLAVPRLDEDNEPDNAAIAFFVARTAEHLLLEEEKRKVWREVEEAKRQKEVVELLSVRATLYHWQVRFGVR